MVDETDIATIGIAVDTSQIVTANTELDRFLSKGPPVDAMLARWEKASAAAFKDVSPALRDASGSTSQATAGFTRLSDAMEAAKGATLGHTAATKDATAAHSAHAVGVAAVGQALDGFTAATGRSTGAMHGATAAHKSHAAAAYGNRLQMMELAHVGRALFDEMASGGSIVRGLAMEFGRLQIAVTSGEGGISGMLGRVGSLASRLASPMALATGGIAALGAASAYSFARYEEEQEALERSLNGRGRGNGLTQARLNALARDSAAAGGLSTAEGVDLVSRYTGAGLSGQLSGQLTGMTKEYSRLTGQGLDKGGDALAKAFADPIRGLADLDRSLGFVDARLKDQVEDLVHSGHLAQAQALELDALTKAMHGASDSTWSFSKALSGAENWTSNKFNQLGQGVANALGYGSDADKLAEMRTRASNLEKVDPIGNADYIAELKKQMLPLMASVSASEQKAADQARDNHERDLSGPITLAVRTALPELARARTTADTLGLLRDAMSDPDIRRFVSPDVYASIGRAYENTAVMARMTAPGVADRQNYDLSLSRIRDWGVQDQGLNSARQAELEVLRETGDLVRAAAAAQRSYNLEIAKANEAADDRLQQAKLDSGLIGLSPYDRAKQQLRNEYFGDRGIIERDRVDSTRIMDDKDIRNDLMGGRLAPATSGLAAFSEGLDGAAKRLATFPPAGTGPYGTLDRNAFGHGAGASVPFFAAGAKAFDAAPATIQAQALAASAQTGIPASIIAAIGKVENSYKLSGGTTMLGADGRPSSAWGFGQLTDGAARDVAGVVPGFSKYNPNTAVFGSAEYLRILMDRNHGDLGMALRAYGGTADYPSKIAQAAGDAAASTLTIHPAVAPVSPIAATAERSDRRVYAMKDADIDKSYLSADPLQRGTPLGEATLRLKEESAALDIQAAMFGKTEGAIKGAAAAQGLWAQYLDSGATKTIKLSDATGALADAVRTYGSDIEKVAQREEDQRRQQKQVMDLEDLARGGLASSVSGGLIGMAHGQGFGKAFSSGMSSLGDRLIGMGVNDIFGSFLGQQGKGAGTGLFGSLFGGGSAGGFGAYGPQQPSGFAALIGNLMSGLPHFAGGTTNAPGGPTIVGEAGPELIDMPKSAQVLTADQTSGLMQSRSSGPSHTFNFGDTHIHPVGGAQFTDDQIRQISGQVQQGQQQTVEHLIRNLPQIQSDARQYG